MATTQWTFWQADTCSATPGVPCTLSAAVQTFNGHFPGPTFDVRQGSPIIVSYINQLNDDDLFRIDPLVSAGYNSPIADATLLNPFDATYSSLATDPLGLHPPGTTQSRAVVRLHGGHTPSPVDGEPDSWFDSTVRYDNLSSVTPTSVGDTFCSSLYKYPNTRYPGVAWYHSHGDAETRIGTFAGMAGFYILRLPLGSPALLDDLFPGVFDFPLALGDRTFGRQSSDTCLCYSVAPQTNDLQYGVWQPEWGGRVAVVNGKIWPLLRVAASAYRFRLLNIASARTWALQIRVVDHNTSLAGGAASNGRFSASAASPSLDSCQSAIPAFYQIGTGNGLFVNARDVVASGMLVAPAERPEIVIDFRDSPVGCTYELYSNAAPFPYQGYQAQGAYTVLSDPAPLSHLIRFTVSAGGASPVGASATTVAAFRRMVDAALLAQSAEVSNSSGFGLPLEYTLPGVDEGAIYPSAITGAAQDPAQEADHSGPAPGAFQVLMRNISALPACPVTPLAAFQPRQPGDCLRRLALAEQQACPACWTVNGVSQCDTNSDLFTGSGVFANNLTAAGVQYRGLYGDIANMPVLGPRAPQQVPSSAEFNQACIATGFPGGAVPGRVIMGEAVVNAADGRITPFPHPYMSMASDSETILPSAQFISLSSKTAAGRVYGGEYWDLYNWTPDMHPIHLHLVEFRIVARFVVGVADVDGSGYIDADQEVAGGDCAQNAYFEYPEQSEIYAAKDIAKVYPARTTDNANVPFAQGFQPKCAPFTRIYAIFEDYAGSYVWHCRIIEHEDMDMMRPFTTCLPRDMGGDASCSNAQTTCRAFLPGAITQNPGWCPSQTVTYNNSNGFIRACP